MLNARLGLRPQDCNPAQRQTQLLAVAQHQVGYDVERLEIEIRLEEAIEQYQAIGARADQLPYEIRLGDVSPAFQG